MTNEVELFEHAQRMAEKFNEEALQLHHQRQKDNIEPQCIVDGDVLCLDCGNAVPEERLKAVPNACRCGDCQNIIDRKRAHFVTRTPWK